MIYLGFLLHIYQPPNQFETVLKQITGECYRPLLNLIVEENAKFTLNINWSLTEQLMKRGYEDVIDLLQQGADTKCLEWVGSAAYHAILPLIPEQERTRQIDLNYSKHKELFGPLYAPRGFFPPEMAYGPEIIPFVKKAGYQWLITDDIPYQCVHESVPTSFIPVTDGFGVLLRSSLWSNRIAFDKGLDMGGDEIARWLMKDMAEWFNGKDGYIILAMDGETFGHHRPGYIESFLVPFLNALKSSPDEIRLIHLSEIFDHFPKVESEVPPGSWSTTVEDFWAGNFFPLWKDPRNQAHYLLWQLTELALSGFEKLRDQMDRSLNSCTFWWAATQPEQCSPITLSGIDMLLEVIKTADPANYKKAKEIRASLEKALNRKAAKVGVGGE